jgi:hypothetical protein
VPIEASLIPILEARFVEAGRSLHANAQLAAKFRCGSVPGGLLPEIALASQRQLDAMQFQTTLTARIPWPQTSWSDLLWFLWESNQGWLL